MSWEKNMELMRKDRDFQHEISVSSTDIQGMYQNLEIL